MKYIYILFLICSLSACSLISSLPDTETLIKDIKRAEINLDQADELNRRLYESKIIDLEQMKDNKAEISFAKDQMRTLKILLNMGHVEKANEDLESIKETLESIQTFD